MPVKYYLQPNPATPDPNDQSARVSTLANLTEADLAQEMYQRNMAVKPDAALAMITAFLSLVGEKVAAGFAVNTSLFTARPGITGVFTDVNDSFDPARHVLRANFQMGPLVRQQMAAASVEKIAGGEPAPAVVAFVNQNTGDLNATITPGGIGQARGEQLKFGTADTEGIFFVNHATNAATRVATVAKKTEGELMFLCPTLAAATYRLEVRRLYGANKDQMRTGHLAEHLTVA
jgi:hypothetical protein